MFILGARLSLVSSQGLVPMFLRGPRVQRADFARLGAEQEDFFACELESLHFARLEITGKAQRIAAIWETGKKFEFMGNLH
jgi:hypothetical protein